MWCFKYLTVLMVLELSCFTNFVDNQIIESQNRSKRNHENSHYTNKNNVDRLANKKNIVSNVISPNAPIHVPKPKRKHKKIKSHRKKPLLSMVPYSNPKVNNVTQNDSVVINSPQRELPLEVALHQDKTNEEPANKNINEEDIKLSDAGTVNNQTVMMPEPPNEIMNERQGWPGGIFERTDEDVENDNENVDTQHSSDDHKIITHDNDKFPLKSNNIEIPGAKLNVLPLFYSNAEKTSKKKKQTETKQAGIESQDQDNSNIINAVQNVENPDLNNVMLIENITSQEYSEKLSPYGGLYNEIDENPYTSSKDFESARAPVPYYVVDCNAPNNHNGYGNRVYYPTEVINNIGNGMIPIQYLQESYRHRNQLSYMKIRYPKKNYDRIWKKSQRILYRIVNNKTKLKKNPRKVKKF